MVEVIGLIVNVVKTDFIAIVKFMIALEKYEDSYKEVKTVRTLSSWVQFKKNWKKVILGSLRYLIFHPIMGPRILYTRLSYIWKNFQGPLLVPEGFRIRYNHQLLVYGVIFIEHDLYNSYLINELLKKDIPYIIDVGANVGMFAQWISIYNPTAFFTSFEPCKEYVAEAHRINNEHFINNSFKNFAVGECDGWVNLNFGTGISTREDVPKTLRDYKVKQTSLDNSIPADFRPFLIKIDTDGSNLRVLTGATEVLKRTRFVLIEKESDYSEFFKGWTCIDNGNDYIYENPNI